MRFSIRSFGSWGEARQGEHRATFRDEVSVSALSDRGVRPEERAAMRHMRRKFQYPLFRIVG